MFNHHSLIFVTFAPVDTAKARRFVYRLEQTFPDRIFLGRHLSTEDGVVAASIARTTLTLILETKHTSTSRIVAGDVRLSLAKVPRNEILRIALDGECNVPNSGGDVTDMLSGLGCERVEGTIAAVGDALLRLDLLVRHEPKIQKAVGHGAPGGSLCNRV